MSNKNLYSIVGRPPKEIDWEKVAQLLIYGYNLTQIAAELNVHYNTLSDKIKAEFGLTFTEFSTHFVSKGDGLLKAAAFKKAMQGNTNVLMSLYEKRIERKENNEISNQAVIDKDKQIAELQAERYNLKKEIEELRNGVVRQTSVEHSSSDTPA